MRSVGRVAADAVSRLAAAKASSEQIRTRRRPIRSGRCGRTAGRHHVSQRKHRNRQSRHRNRNVDSRLRASATEAKRQRARCPPKTSSSKQPTIWPRRKSQTRHWKLAPSAGTTAGPTRHQRPAGMLVMESVSAQRSGDPRRRGEASRCADQVRTGHGSDRARSSADVPGPIAARFVGARSEQPGRVRPTRHRALGHDPGVFQCFG